jgi:hypothetical protein
VKVAKGKQLSKNLITVDISKDVPLGQHNENAIIIGTTPNDYDKAIVGSVFTLEVAKISKTEVLNNVENCLVYISIGFPSIDELIKVVAPNDEKKEYNQIYRKNNRDCYCFKAVSFSIHSNTLVDYLAYNMPLSDIRDFSGLNVFLMPRAELNYVKDAFESAGIFFESSPIINARNLDKEERHRPLTKNVRIQLFEDYLVFFGLVRAFIGAPGSLDFTRTLHLGLGDTYSESIVKLNDFINSDKLRSIAENLTLALILGAYIKQKDLYLSTVKKELLIVIHNTPIFEGLSIRDSEINEFFDEVSKGFYEE